MRRLTFFETMSGSYHLNAPRSTPGVMDTKGRAAPLVERPLSFTIQTESRRLLSFLRQPELSVRGEISAEGFADHKVVHGTLTIDLLRTGLLPYFLYFRGNDGKRYSFEGRKVIVPGAFVESMTVLPAALRDERGLEIGRSLVRFDLRSDLFSFLQSFRLERFG